MTDLLNLDELGARLSRVDRHIVALLAQRMALSLQVEEYKRRTHQPIFRSSIEDKRLEDVRAWAKDRGLNPNFAHAVLYLAISESFKVQMAQRQQHGDSDTLDVTEDFNHNLPRLTEQIAKTYDTKYDAAFFATRSYLNFEDQILDEEIKSLDDHSLALDIGCATGRIALDLRFVFERVVGYDLSPAMIEQANLKAIAQGAKTIDFQQVDIEQGIPQSDVSVALIVMNLGTASDLRKIDFVLSEADRVLIPGGKIFLSFYNSEALLYQWEFLPWPISLAAEINIRKHCLNVRYEGQVFPIYAKAFSLEEVRNLIPSRLELTRTLTYPTISSILPDEIFDNRLIQQSVVEIDRKLAESNTGAYIITVGCKN